MNPLALGAGFFAIFLIGGPLTGGDTTLSIGIGIAVAIAVNIFLAVGGAGLGSGGSDENQADPTPRPTTREEWKQKQRQSRIRIKVQRDQTKAASLISSNDNQPSTLDAIQNETAKVANSLSNVLIDLKTVLQPGIMAWEIEDWCESEIVNRGYFPAMKTTNQFPAAASISINQQVLHGIPGDQKFQSGDIVKVQTAMKGRHAFANQGWTYLVGDANDERRKFADCLKNTLRSTAELVLPGTPVGDVGEHIQSHIESAGYSIVREYCGYGMGEKMFQDPQILCYGKKGRGPKFESGMIINLQIIATSGKRAILREKDDWTISTKDGKDGGVVSIMIQVDETGNRFAGKFID